jgi:hypothetical protein
VLKRLWLAVSLIWAGCVLIPDLDHLTPKLILIAILPYAAGIVTARLGRFVIAGK